MQNFDWAKSRSNVMRIAMLFIVVVLRSYVGMIMVFSWKSGYWIWVSVICVVLGKLLGGMLSDRIGPKAASAVSLGGACILFMFSHNPVAGTAAILCFNMTMPITLWSAAGKMKGCKGFAFGLLTFALFIGFLPVWAGCRHILSCGVGYGIWSLISLVLLLIGIKGETYDS